MGGIETLFLKWGHRTL